MTAAPAATTEVGHDSKGSQHGAHLDHDGARGNPAVGGPTPAPVDERRITAEEAAAIAVNEVTELGAGYHLRHPRRHVDFTPHGVRVEGVRGAPEWTWNLEHISSSIGRVLLEAGPVAPTAVEPTLIRYDRCVLHEDYRLKQSSVEQLLVIPEPLHLGGDDLVVTGAVACDGELTEDRHGWTWRGPRGEVTLGRVTVLDADGEVLPARLEVTATSTRLVVDGDALLTAAYPVVVDPEIGTNDYPISSMGPGGDTRYRATLPAVAYNSVDNEYLVVWRGNDGGDGMDMFEYEIFGQVVDASGNQVGYSDVRISYAGGTGSDDAQVLDPNVAFNTTRNEYMVVWSADNTEEGCVGEEYEIWGQVLAADLFPLYGRFRVSSNGGTGDPTFDASHPAVTYNPDLNQYLVVWGGEDSVDGMVEDEEEVFAQMLTWDGQEIGPNDERISDAGDLGNTECSAGYPVVAANTWNGELLVAWQGDEDEYYFVPGETEIIIQRMDGMALFVDPFESGDPTGWSSAVP